MKSREILLRTLQIGLLLFVGIIVPYLICRSVLKNDGAMMLMIGALFFGYPTVLFFLGRLVYRQAMHIVVCVVVIALELFGTFSVIFNSSAFSYIPFYIIAFLIGASINMSKTLPKRNM